MIVYFLILLVLEIIKLDFLINKYEAMTENSDMHHRFAFRNEFQSKQNKNIFLIISLVNILNVLPLDFVQVIKKETMAWSKDISHNKHLIYSAKTGKVRGISWCLLQIPRKTLFKPTLQKVTVHGTDISTKSLALCHRLPLFGCKSQIRTEMEILVVVRGGLILTLHPF